MKGSIVLHPDLLSQRRRRGKLFREKKVSSQLNSLSHPLEKSNPTFNRSNRTSNIDSSPNENENGSEGEGNPLGPPLRPPSPSQLDFEPTTEESDEGSDLPQFRQKLQKYFQRFVSFDRVNDFRSTDDEKLSLLEDHRLMIEEFKRHLRLEQEREEALLREQMKTELLLSFISSKFP